MITLTVVAFNDAPADGTLQAHFDELGGSIGRAESNQLVLPDPERMVSRVAAQVLYRNGAFAVVDRGSNPISLNGRVLASGREAPLAPGDRLGVCGYELRVEAGGAAAAVASDPFSGLFGPAPAAPAPGRPPPDPLARPGAAASSRAPVSVPAPAAGGIPVDWDPFAAQPPGVAGPAPRQRDALGLETGGAAPESLIPDLSVPSAAPSSLDQLFGLGPSGGGDPLADSPLDAPMAQPNMAADVDPLRSLGSAPRASAATEADQLSDLNRPFIPPTVIKAAAPPRATPPREAPAMPASGDATVIHAKVQPAPVAVPAAAPPPATAAPPLAAASPAPVRPLPPGRAADSDALLDAFRRGLDAPSLELPALTPAVMEAIGQMLNEAVRGTMALLNAPAPAKRGLGAGAAASTRSDNPLRFSPDVEVALRQLLAPPARGCLAAGPAMRQAHDDLRRQQFDLVAGVQAALEDALQRVDPATLAVQLGDGSLLRSLLPTSRNAQLWEAFVALQPRLREDTGAAFRQLFSRGFLTAYDEHVGRQQAPGGRGAAAPTAAPGGKRRT